MEKIMNIIGLKLVTGEEIIAQSDDGFVGDEQGLILTNPIIIQFMQGPNGQPAMRFLPWPTLSDPKSGTKVFMKKDRVVCTFDPDQELVNQYNTAFGSGIVVPPKTILQG